MNKLDQLRMSEKYDEFVSDEEMIEFINENTQKDFKEEYKKFYSDIKLSIKEDW